MLLTFVYSLIGQVSGLAANLRAAFSHRQDIHEHGDWDTTTLLQVVRHVFKETKRPIGLFLDGLDEFTGTYREQLDLALYLAELPSLGDVKICFASRPDEILDQKFGSGLLLDMQDWNQPGIQNFLCKTFFDIGLASSQLQAAQASHLSGLMAEMAEGVFIWAKFAVDDVIQLWAKQKLEFALLLLKLAQLPREVETFWDERRERLSEVEKRAGSLLLRIACSAARPLALSELMDVFENQCPDNDIWLSLDASQETQDQVSYLSCGLLESEPDVDNMLESLQARQRKINTTGLALQGRKVLLAHKSVRRYLEIRGWWLADDETPSPEQLWLEQCTGLIAKATYAQQRSLCFQNRPHDKSNPVCKVYGCYSTYVASGFPRELYEELHGRIERVVIDATTSRRSNMITEAYRLATRRKVTFMKKEYFSNPLNSYAFHWLAYHAWLLESRRQKLCIEATNAIMCPELIILMSAFKHHSCPFCGNVQPTTEVRFHAADDVLLGFAEKPATTYNTLLFGGVSDDSRLIAQEEHYANQLALALFVSKGTMRSNEGERPNEETSSILALPGNSEPRIKFICIMQLERLKRHEDRGFPVPTAKYLRGAPKQRKIAVVGPRGSQRSSLIVQFVDGHFVESYYPTIENSFSKIIQYQGQDFATEIVDSADQDEYLLLNSKHFIGIHGYMIVYSVTSKQSFKMARVIHDKILDHLGSESVPTVIVGNCSDARLEQRQVTSEESRQLAEDLKCPVIEASARYNENVALAFETCIAEIEKSQEPDRSVEQRSCCLM